MDIISAARRYNMFSPGDVVLVAVSGGPDSVAMLHALWVESAHLGIRLQVAHLNHCLRRPDSDKDEQFVRDLAEELGLPASFTRVDVKAECKKRRCGVEETARQVRYEFFEETAAKIGANRIAVGHNADDRSESVLLNVIRGAGINGLASIRPVRGNIVRPLIDTPRSAIEDYLTHHGLRYRTDNTNFDTKFTRNKVRYELIPAIEREFNPRIQEALVRLSELASATRDALAVYAEKERTLVTLQGGIDVGLLGKLPTAISWEIIRNEIEAAKGDLDDVGFDAILRVAEAAQSGADFVITLPSGVIQARCRSGRMVISRVEHTQKAEFRCPLTIPGITQIPEAGIQIEATICNRPTNLRIPADKLVIDPKSIEGPLIGRNTEPGDRMVPFGMTDPKKLQDILTDKKIPRARRAKAVVVADSQRILWVVGIASSEHARVSDDCGEVMLLASCGL